MGCSNSFFPEYKVILDSPLPFERTVFVGPRSLSTHLLQVGISLKSVRREQVQGPTKVPEDGSVERDTKSGIGETRETCTRSRGLTVPTREREVTSEFIFMTKKMITVGEYDSFCLTLSLSHHFTVSAIVGIESSQCVIMELKPLDRKLQKLNPEYIFWSKKKKRKAS